MTEKEFRRLVSQALIDNPTWRYGQALYNTASELLPVARVAAGTPIDPFHNDLRGEFFIQWLRDIGAFDA